jgi:hypothetical protein
MPKPAHADDEMYVVKCAHKITVAVLPRWHRVGVRCQLSVRRSMCSDQVWNVWSSTLTTTTATSPFVNKLHCYSHSSQIQCDLKVTTTYVHRMFARFAINL